MIDRELFDRIFMPRTVAIAGSTLREPADLIRETLLAAGFQGSIYIVDPRYSETAISKVYGRVTDVPGPVDFVLCCKPAAEILPFLSDCAAKQVGAVAILTGAFSQSGTRDDVRLLSEIAVLAEKTGLRVMGPNCLGIYCPRGGMSFASRLSVESGRMGFICQSREISIPILRAAGHRGVKFSKAVCHGNSSDISESDLLEYLARDGDTDVVAACVDSVKDGPRLVRVLNDLARVKPVIVLKTRDAADEGGGESGRVKSRDGSSDRSWKEMLNQTGAVRVNSAEGMVDAMVTFASLPVPQGRKVGIFGAAGGASVLATDVWASHGFLLPPPPPELRAVLDDTAINQAGMILHNPLDFSMVGYTGFFFDVVKEMIAHEGFVDLGMIHNPSGHGAWLPWPAFNGLIDSITDAVIRIHKEVPRPMALVMQYIASREHWQKIFEDLQVPCSQSGVPVYYSMASAATAVDRMLGYYERRADPAEIG